MAKTEPHTKYAIGAREGEYPIPMPPPIPRSMSDLPAQDRGAKLSLTIAPITQPDALRFQLTFTAGEVPVRRELDDQWSRQFPFLFAFYVDGRAVTLPNVQQGQNFTGQVRDELTAIGQTRQWGALVDSQSIRNLLPDHGPHSVSVVAAFSNSSQEPVFTGCG